MKWKMLLEEFVENDIIVIDELGTTKGHWDLGVIKRIIDGVIDGNKRLFTHYKL